MKKKINVYKWIVIISVAIISYQKFTSYHQNIGYERAKAERARAAYERADMQTQESLKKKLSVYRNTNNTIPDAISHGVAYLLGGGR